MKEKQESVVDFQLASLMTYTSTWLQLNYDIPKSNYYFIALFSNIDGQTVSADPVLSSRIYLRTVLVM